MAHGGVVGQESPDDARPGKGIPTWVQIAPLLSFWLADVCFPVKLTSLARDARPGQHASNPCHWCVMWRTKLPLPAFFL